MDLKVEWYRALAAEDSEKVARLLVDCETLLDDGRGSRGGTSYYYYDQQSSGNRRTALHVAATWGNVALMRQILKLVESKAPPLQGGDRSSPFEEWKQYKEESRIQCTEELVEWNSKHEEWEVWNQALLEAREYDYGLDALAMATLNGNLDIVNLLKEASSRCKFNPYFIKRDALHREIRSIAGQPESLLNWENRSEELTLITDLIFQAETNEVKGAIKQWYDEDCNFNFLPMSVYLFHFTFGSWLLPMAPEYEERLYDIRNRIFEAAARLNLVRYLLFELRDGQGRTPLHVAVDSQKVKEFLAILPGHKNQNKDLDHLYLNVPDSAGRTPLYRAAAKNHCLAVQHLLLDSRTHVCAQINTRPHHCGAGLDIDELSSKNGFMAESAYIPFDKISRSISDIGSLDEISSTALHVAVIHKHELIVELLLNHHWPAVTGPEEQYRCPGPGCPRFLSDVDCRRNFAWPVGMALQDNRGTSENTQRVVSTMQLAVLVGNIPILQQLLKEDKEKNCTTPNSDDPKLPGFLLAAAMGNPRAVKGFLDSGQNAFITDSTGNTALHYAVMGSDVKLLQPHLVDFVGCAHVRLARKTSGARRSDDRITDLKQPDFLRIKAINMLLQAGIDIWQQNAAGRTASPYLSLSEEFQGWWYDKEAQELQREQKELKAGANAISVTAALVATASYVGPLQPPLGYGGDSAAMQVQILSVRIFIVCDTLSFYLALAAIMLALVPSLPTPQESLMKGLMRTRIVVLCAVAFLFPSIICVLMAFAAGSVAAISGHHGLAHHGLTLSTTVVGGFFCLVVMIVFARRLRKVFRALPINVKKHVGKFFRDIFLLDYVVSIYRSSFKGS